MAPRFFFIFAVLPPGNSANTQTDPIAESRWFRGHNTRKEAGIRYYRRIRNIIVISSVVVFSVWAFGYERARSVSDVAQLLRSLALTVLVEAKTVANQNLEKTFPRLILPGYEGVRQWEAGLYKGHEAECFLLSPKDSPPQAPERFIEGRIIAKNYVGSRTLISICHNLAKTRAGRRRSLVSLISDEVNDDAKFRFVETKKGETAAYKVSHDNRVEKTISVTFYVSTGLRVRVFGREGKLNHRIVDSVAGRLADKWPRDPLLLKHLSRRRTSAFLRKKKEALWAERLEGAERSSLVSRIPKYRELIKKGALRFATMEDVKRWARRAEEPVPRLYWKAAKRSLEEHNAFVITKYLEMPSGLSTAMEKPLFFVADEAPPPTQTQGHAVFFSSGQCTGCP